MTNSLRAISLTFGLAASAAFSAMPPATLNYQGVLRNASDKPLTGTYDLTFGFYDALTGGTQILVDTHAVSGSGGVAVTGGLFNTQLGGGTVTDGSGAGTYTSLADVFRDYGAVWVEIKVGAETLSPRVKIQAAAYAQNATSLGGVAASGYVNTTSAAQTKTGPFTANATGASQYGIQGYGTNGGGYFSEQTGASALYASAGGYAASGIGSSGGAYFYDTTGSTGYLAHSGYGVEGYGNNSGGHFKNTGTTTTTELASPGFGVFATATYMGGYFLDTTYGGAAWVGYGGYGIEGFGSNGGGYFKDSDDGTYVYLGSNGWPVYAVPPYNGSQGAGFFTNGVGTAYTVLGTDTTSVYGGAFPIKAVIDASYNTWSGDFVNNYNGTFGRTTYAAPGVVSSFYGNGTKNFAQNHPYDATKTISYACLEGDEAGTYTRGSARLANGEARVTLGETFQWVTNPDVGLTAQVTPRGAASLYVASISTTELVVRSASGNGNVTFDYVVQGLRVGFEETAVVSDRTTDVKLPAVTGMDERMASRPDLDRYTALHRFRRMATDAGLAASSGDMTRGLALRAAIGEYDHDRDRESLAGPSPSQEAARRAMPAGEAPVPSVAAAPPLAEAAPAQPSAPALANQVRVLDSVLAGDVLAADPDGREELRAAVEAADPRVVGIVAGEPGKAWSGAAPIALAGSIVLCSVDASFGAIATGDLLVTSTNPGHAMRAGDGPHEGRVVAKALEPLPSGTGTIRVLVMAR